MEARDLTRARSYLAEDFVMTFPGGAVFHDLEALVAWAGQRYRGVTKSYEKFDDAPSESGVAVYGSGTLRGQWPDGTRFDGVRFIDRFTVVGGKLADQEVWNDLAEARLGRGG